MRMTDELDRLVLDAVGDDFIPLEQIVRRLAVPGRISGKLDPDLLFSRLLDLIADKLVSAYLLHADPPYITPVSAPSGALPASWFYITERGRKCLAHASRRGGSPDSDTRGDDRYTPAVNF